MVALLPPYVETAPQLCEFEGSKSMVLGQAMVLGLHIKQQQPKQFFFVFFPISKGPHLSGVPNLTLHSPPPTELIRNYIT